VDHPIYDAAQTEMRGSISMNITPEPSAFRQLAEFITKKMRMSHLYQPLMLRTLIKKGGTASLRDIASTFLVHDESQIGYYTENTKRMPGRDGDGYRARYGISDRCTGSEASAPSELSTVLTVRSASAGAAGPTTISTIECRSRRGI
jgi:hypothetical protein